MATVREGNRPVMIVVDVQVGVMKEAWEAQRVIKNISHAVERARSEAVPVIWVQHSNHELPEGSAQWQWVPELVPAAGEALIHKKYNSSFEQTPLDSKLASLVATHIVLAGAATNWCIRATAYGALDRGYDLTLVKDAHTTESMQLDGGVTIQAETVIQELNIAMKWLEYPGVENGTASANEIKFAVPGGVK
jgi:nicotinamidase-related amidase